MLNGETGKMAIFTALFLIRIAAVFTAESVYRTVMQVAPWAMWGILIAVFVRYRIEDRIKKNNTRQKNRLIKVLMLVLMPVLLCVAGAAGYVRPPMPGRIIYISSNIEKNEDTLQSIDMRGVFGPEKALYRNQSLLSPSVYGNKIICTEAAEDETYSVIEINENQKTKLYSRLRD
jgi:hypothetical protein